PFCPPINGIKLSENISSILASLLGFLPSLDQPIRSGEHLRRNYQIDFLAMGKEGGEKRKDRVFSPSLFFLYFDPLVTRHLRLASHLIHCAPHFERYLARRS